MVQGGKLVFLCQLRMEPQGLVPDEPTTNSSAQYYRFSPARYTHPFPTLGPTERKPQEKSPGRIKKKNCALFHTATASFSFSFFFLYFCSRGHVFPIVSSLHFLGLPNKNKTNKCCLGGSLLICSRGHFSCFHPYYFFSSTKATLLHVACLHI
jgi:hypothetical protein